MTLAIALQTETFELSFAFRRYATGSGGDLSLWLLVLALGVTLCSLALDFLLVGAGGWLAIWPVTLALGGTLAVAGWEVRRCYGG